MRSDLNESVPIEPTGQESSVDLKVCTKCLIEKPATEFHKHSRSKDGYRSMCKECGTVVSKPNFISRFCHKFGMTEEQMIIALIFIEGALMIVSILLQVIHR